MLCCGHPVAIVLHCATVAVLVISPNITPVAAVSMKEEARVGAPLVPGNDVAAGREVLLLCTCDQVAACDTWCCTKVSQFRGPRSRNYAPTLKKGRACLRPRPHPQPQTRRVLWRGEACSQQTVRRVEWRVERPLGVLAILPRRILGAVVGRS